MAALVSGAMGWILARRLRAHRGADVLPGVVMLLAGIPLPSSVRAMIGGRVDADGLITAGLPPDATAPVIVRARAGGAVAGVAFGVASAVLLAPLLLVLTPLWMLIGRLGPDRAVARRARARRAAIVEALPDLLDLMVICVEAGMALDPALSLAADRLGGPLGEEVRATLSDQALGTPRRLAYRGLASRTASEDVGRLVASLLQAEELGTPLATALAGQAEALRAARRQRARDRAARAAPRIQLVVALVMVPGAMLLVLGVMVVEMAAQVGIALGGP
ncbi:MAG: type II secretion system F family protein [Miltoncostaeaceae bacterium]